MKMDIRVIGVKMDLGAGRRGVDMGPTALRIAGLQSKLESMKYKVEDHGDLDVANAENASPVPARAKYLNEIAATCENLAAIVKKTKEEKKFPIVMGGDHSIAIGTIAGLSTYYKETNQKFAVVWIDAHADMNTPESSPSGNIHGMPLSACLGIGEEKLVNCCSPGQKVAPENVYLIGIRDIDPIERKIVNESGVNAYSMEDIDRIGVYAMITGIMEDLDKKGIEAVHISLDVDGLDPSIAPGVGTPVQGGLNFREAHLIMEVLSESQKVGSLEITEVNPILDVGNKTAENAVDLVSSSLGKTIL